MNIPVCLPLTRMHDGGAGWTVRSVLAWTTDYFSRQGIPEPRCDAEVLLAGLLGCGRGALLARQDDPVAGDILAQYRTMIAARIRRLPVAYIQGWTEFMGLRFSVNHHTLVPRPETELLVEEVVKLISSLPAGKPVTVADIGTGSGCIALSLAKCCPEVRVVAVDISADALAVAYRNAVDLGLAGRVQLLHGDLTAPLDASGLARAIDIIVSNPPYVLSAEIPALSPEVRSEPRAALDGGTDGQDYYRRLAAEATRFLVPGGWIALELHPVTVAVTADMFRRTGFVDLRILNDYAGMERMLIARAS